MANNNEEDKISVNTILTDSFRSIVKARGPLSRLYRIILADLKIGPMVWDRLMERYLDDPNNHIPKSGKQRSTERGNLSKQLTSDPMSIKGFLKGMKFLGATRLKITVEITRRKETSVHSVELEMASADVQDTLDGEED